MALLLSRDEVDNLTSQKMINILSLKVVEKTQIDYKSTLDFERAKETYKDLLKDITSFANSRGGIILAGVKEPSDDLAIEEQVIGMKNCKEVSANIERVCTTSIEPRIPSLTITYVKVFEGKEIIVIYIPASFIKPHMVNYNGHRSFYIRHSESSAPMNVQEIRDSVLFSSNIEKTALLYAQEEELDVLDYYVKSEPVFILQAVPLLNLEMPIDVQSKVVDDIISGATRSSSGDFCLNSFIKATPTLKGVMGSNSRNQKEWISEIHRNGFIQLIYFIRSTNYSEKETYYLYDNYTKLFRTFLNFCREIWEKLDIDLPYLFRCKIVNSKGLIYYPENSFRTIEEKFERHQIVFQNQVKNIGEDLDEIYMRWEQQFYNVQGKWK